MVTHSAPATTSSPVCLDDLWSALCFDGPDAREFLANQLTCDLRQLDDRRAQLGAYLNPKGRILALLVLAPWRDGLLALVNPQLADAFVRRIRMYILRARVTVEPMPGWSVWGEHAEGPVARVDHLPLASADDEVVIGWPGHRQLRIHRRAEPDRSIPLAESDWLAREIDAAVPHVFNTTSETFIPQMLGLDHLGAVSFKKGCYPGQEIVARMHYLGKNKRHLHRARFAQSVDAGEALVTAAGQAAGNAVQCARTDDGYAALVVLHDAYQNQDLTTTAGLECENPLLVWPN